MPRYRNPEAHYILAVPLLLGVICIVLSVSTATDATMFNRILHWLYAAQGDSNQATHRYTSRRNALLHLGNMTAKPLKHAQAELLLKWNAMAQQKVIDRCAANDCYKKLPVVSSYGEYKEGTSSSAALQWVAQLHDARNIIEIGASYGGGSTMVLGKAAREANRTVTSIEAHEAKFLFGINFYSSGGNGNGLPVELILGSSVAAQDFPNERDLVGMHDYRPAKWLQAERSLAENRGFGILAPLLKTRDFGLVFVDGAAFTGPAEWAIIRDSKPVGWIALDDTHAKTLSILFAAKHVQPYDWEIVYEELNAAGMVALKGINYDMTEGQVIRPSEKQKQSAAQIKTKWKSVGWRRWSLSPIGLAAKRAIEDRTIVVDEPRNFAILRRKSPFENDEAPFSPRSPPRKFRRSRRSLLELLEAQNFLQCNTCYKLTKSVPHNLKTSPSDSRIVMAKQASNQKRVTQRCVYLKCFQDLRQPSRDGYLEESTRAWVALRWAARQHEARQILSIGASYGEGATMVLANAARERKRIVAVIEPSDQRFLWGKRLYEQQRLPVKMLLGASVSVDDLPMEHDFRAIVDPRPLEKLREERAQAAYHGFGCLSALLGSEGEDFGFVLIDGMEFAGAAEWAIVSKTSTVNWVALFETGTKTTSILLEVRQARDGPWEVMYEELTASGMATLKKLGYDLSEGEGIRSTSSGELLGWSRVSKNIAGLRIERVVQEETMVWNVVRNFALLRRRGL